MRCLREFFKRHEGTIAVEFAFVAPVMIALFFGLGELALAEGVRGDVVNLASVGADLVAQESSATGSDMTNVFNALSAMLYPYNPANVQITISSVVDNNTAATGTVAWSCNQGGGPNVHAKNDTYTFPAAAAGVITKGGGGSVIVAEVNYSYSLPVTITIPGIITLSGPYAMTNTFYSKPRKVLQIPLTACS